MRTILILIVGALAASTIACSAAYPPAPTTIIDDSVQKTVSTAAKDGWVPCPGACLKLSQPGWQHMHVEGFPESDYWMKWTFVDPAKGEGWQAFSQRHIGHIIHVYPDKPAEDTGNCPTCNGTGWVRK